MDLNEIRRRLQHSIVPGIEPTDPELFQTMWQQLEQLAGGAFLSRTREILADYEQEQPIRPNFPNRMQFLYMRDRQTFTFALFPQLLPLAYQAGRAIGAAYDAPRRHGLTLPQALESAITVAQEFDYGYQEIIQADETFAIYRTYECADCYGLPNIGLKICAYEAGVAAGALERVLNKPVRVEEVKCCANGDLFDEYHVHVSNEVNS
jgi:uncharacterized protein